MGTFTKVASDAFEALQLDAGVLLTAFDPANPYTPPTDAAILATTTGGINPVCEPTYEDFGEDVDNVPNNMMEFKKLTGWNCTMGFSSIKFNAANVAWSLGASTVSTLTNGVKKIIPNRNLSLADFADLWWVGDKANGGAFAVKLKNALSTGGLNIQSSKNGKGTNQVTITGHVSINDQNDMPMEFYDIPPQEGATTVSVTQNLTNVTSSFSATSVSEGGSLTATLTAASNHTIDNDQVSITMGGVDIKGISGVYNTSTHVVTIGKVTAPVVITAVAEANS